MSSTLGAASPTSPQAKLFGMSAGLRIALAAIAAGVLYNIPGWLVPQLTQGAIEHFHFSAGAAGLIPTCENLIAGITSLAFARRTTTQGLKRLSIAATIVFFAGNVATYPAVHFFTGVAPLVICRVVTGLSTGALIYISSTLAAKTARPDRTFGQLTMAANAFVAFLLWSLAWLKPDANSLDVFPYGAFVALIWLPLLLIQAAPDSPGDGEGAIETTAATPHMSPFVVIALIVAMNAANSMNLANFIFAEPLGIRTGMAPAAVQVAMGTSMLLSTLGAVAVQFLPRRAGHAMPLTIALFGFFATNYFTVTTESSEIFRVSLILSQILGFFIIPLFLGWSADLDASGRTAATLNSSFVLVYALCPALAGVLVDRFTLSVLPLQSAVLSGIAIGCVIVLRIMKPLERDVTEEPEEGIGAEPAPGLP